MRTRRLGSRGPTVGAIGFGAMNLSADDPEAPRVLERVLAEEVTLLDTANFYAGGENERMLGRALQGKRERAVVSTKYRTPPGDIPAITAVAHASLERLGIEAVDLFYPARVDRSIPIEETVGAMADLVGAGYVRHIGLCEAAAETIRRAHAVHPLTAVQTEYSLFTRDPEREVLATLRELGIGLVAYSPLGRGLLTGAIESPDSLSREDSRTDIPRFAPGNLAHNLALVALVEDLAARLGISASRLSLAWLLHQGEDIVAIPGSRSLVHLEDNLAAADVVLGADDLARLGETFALGAAAGERYPPRGMAVLDG